METRTGPPVKGREAVDVDPVGAACIAAPVDQSLSDVKHQLVFFTPALLLTKAFFDRDPVFEYVEQMAVPESERPLSIDCQSPFFSRLGKTQLGLPPHSIEVDWDRRLYACPIHRWEECREFICRIAVTDHQRRQYSTVGWYTLPVVDVTTLAYGSVVSKLPWIDVVVFAVDTNHGVHYIARAIDPPRSRPYPASIPPSATTIAIAAAIFDEPLDDNTRILP